MTTANQNPRQRPDWSKLDLPNEYLDDLQHYYDIETHMKIACATGMAFLGYIRHEGPSQEEMDLLLLAWFDLVYNRYL